MRKWRWNLGLVGLVWLLFGHSGLAAEDTPLTVAEVGKEMICQCGTCVNELMSACTCGTAQNHRLRIAREIKQGKTKQEIIAGFVADYGEQVLAAPPKSGFNWMAWILPFVAIAAGALVVRSVVVRAVARGKSTPSSPPSSSSTTPAEDDEYGRRFEQELAQLDS